MDEQPKPDVDERREDLRRRRSEAVDVLAETLLAMWLHEQRARRAMRLSPATEARPPEQGSTPSTSAAREDAARACFFGHHHMRLDAEVAGVSCLGLNKGPYPGCLVAFEMGPGERGWRLLGEWPPRS